MEFSTELLAEFNQGKPGAFRAVFDYFRMRIFYFVKNVIQDRLSAEEITSDTFVKLYQRHGNFLTEKKIQAYLFITARNAALDFLESRKRKHIQLAHIGDFQETDEADFPPMGETDIEADVLQFIYSEIENLPKQTKRIFKMCYLENKSVQDIAEILGLSPQTVANTKHTAVKLLRMKVLARQDLLFWLLIAIMSMRHQQPHKSSGLSSAFEVLLRDP